MAKTQVSDLAAEFGMRPQQLTRWLAAKGIQVPNHRGLDVGQVARARTQRELEKRRNRGTRPPARAKQAQRRKGKAGRHGDTRGREPPESHWTIPIRTKLAALIDHWIRATYRGSTNLAWTSVEKILEAHSQQESWPQLARLSRSQLHRLRKGERPSIGEAAVYWLLFLIPDAEALLDAIYSPGARALLGRANSFYEHRELARSVERKEARERVIHAMQASSRKASKAFDSFTRFVRGKGHSKETAELALDRVVAPFVLVPETGHVDREWKDLSSREQRNYVRHALARETILLTRKPDLERARLKGENPLLAALREPDSQTRRRHLRRG